VRSSCPRAALHALFVLGVGLLIAGCAAEQRPPARKATPSAVNITEAFKPVLACHPGTTVGTEGCSERKVLAADARLDADAKVILSLISRSARHNFVTAQTAWLAYRDADCQSQSAVYQGGSERPIVYAECLASDDSARRQDLEGFFASLAYQLTTPPRFP